MKKKNDSASSPPKEVLQKDLKKKSSALERLKRELKIEASLEKVRERTMAMHKSDELHEVVKVLLNELNKLKIGSGKTITIAVVTFNDDKKEINNWIASSAFSTTISTLIPYNKHPILSDLWKAKDSGVPYFAKSYGHKETNEWWKWALVHTSNRDLPDERKKLLLEAETYAHAVAFAKHSGIYIHLDFKKLPAKKESEVLVQFAKIFDQSYIRFLDLQKAEAQARESQIQLAMERVRARTMAMQRSDELSEAASLLFQQVQSLGAPSWTAGYCIWDEDKKAITLWMSSPSGGIQPPFRVPLDENSTFIRYLEADNKGMELYIEEESGKVPEENYQYLLTLPVVREILNAIMKEGFPLPTYQVDHCAYFSKGFLLFITYQQVPELHDIFKRFAAVFDQTYTRFLDLQKAETQARESQIQLALERVRARTMAMQHSDELAEAATLLLTQVRDLGIKTFGAGFNIWQPDGLSVTSFMSNPDGSIQPPFTLPHNENSYFIKISDARQRGENFFVMESGDEELEKLRNYMLKLPAVKEVVGDVVNSENEWPDFQVNHCAFFSQGYLLFVTYERVTETWDIFKRFAKVFEQTYTRFLDLQKSEAQTREAQIELGLERVRAKAMAMQNSEELNTLIGTVFTELTKLDLVLTRCVIIIYDTKTNGGRWWMANSEAPSEPMNFLVKHSEHPPGVAYLKAWQQRALKWEYPLQGAIKKEWDDFLFSETELSQLPGFVIAGMKAPDKVYLNASFNNFGNLTLASLEPLSEEHFGIMLRFAKVFDLTYTRFNDLQKAEAQARESQIELALERVRARTMAMQRSDELREAVLVVYEQLQQLNFESKACNIIIIDKESDTAQYWVSGFSQEIFPESYTVPYLNHPYQDALLKPWKQGNKYVVYEYTGKMKQSFDELFFTQTEFRNVPEEAKKVMIGLKSVMLSTAFISYGALQAIGAEPLSEEKATILKRFAKVFEQTYTRFLDLQKAEAQTREAQIEAALERVRSRSMAMQKSGELQDTAMLLAQQVKALGVPTFACGFNIWDDDRKAAAAWMAGEDRLQPPFKTSSSEDVFFHIHEAAQKGKQLFIANQGGEELKIHYSYMASIPAFKTVMDKMAEAGLSVPAFQVMHCAFFSQGYLMFISFDPVPEAHDIFKRFAKVFEQTYTRFLDLQKAEAQAREVTKRASVDRVRAEIASMRTTNDLERITPLIWNELTILGVPFIRCGVFIMDEEQQQVQTYLYTEGKTIASFTTSFSNTQLIIDALPHWRRKEIYKTHWDEAAFLEQARTLVQQGAIKDSENYLTEHHPTDLYLHFVPFLQGMLYVGDAASLCEEHLQLVQALAEAFSTAYARYEDFNKLEAAKKQVDSTLNELQVTQKQLIQSEKMASLGELTAGIAHEIQNPLNFVNNFSEVCMELIDEMNSELAIGNLQLASEISEDIKTNLEKISHHGKRADSIVKGMLQHSRSTSTTKEPTDINALADEYLRLAYHGLRAKDKSFNATLKTDYDETIGKINVIPQDIGRVILNVITNAFYTVNEKKTLRQAQGDGYEPIVIVSTKKKGDTVEIIIGDNGNGIPQKIVDKIFQPFFTSKPTGQGTGLGLSLAYDIVKAHAGELKVETTEGEGSEFTVMLPL